MSQQIALGEKENYGFDQSTVKPRLTATSLLRPLFLGACQKPPYVFLWKKKTLVDTATPVNN